MDRNTPRGRSAWESEAQLLEVAMMQLARESLREDVGTVVGARDVPDDELTPLHELADEEVADLYVLCAAREDRVLGESNSALIVAPEHRRALRASEISHEAGQPL